MRQERETPELKQGSSQKAWNAIVPCSSRHQPLPLSPFFLPYCEGISKFDCQSASRRSGIQTPRTEYSMYDCMYTTHIAVHCQVRLERPALRKPLLR